MPLVAAACRKKAVSLTLNECLVLESQALEDLVRVAGASSCGRDEECTVGQSPCDSHADPGFGVRREDPAYATALDRAWAGACAEWKEGGCDKYPRAIASYGPRTPYCIYGHCKIGDPWPSERCRAEADAYASAETTMLAAANRACNADTDCTPHATGRPGQGGFAVVARSQSDPVVAQMAQTRASWDAWNGRACARFASVATVSAAPRALCVAGQCAAGR